MKLIGIDYGRRRIGIAVTDETGEFIRSLPVFDRTKRTRYIDELHEIIKREAPTQIVVGLPLSNSNGDTAMSLEIRSFAAQLEEKTSLPVHFIDESLTSRWAYDIIRNRRKKHKRDKGTIDKIAACLILEAFQKEKQ